MLGAALGVPGLAGEAGQILKRALGLAPNVSEATVRSTIEADPEAARSAFAQANSDAAAKWDYLARVIEAQADVAKTQIGEVNETIRAEARVMAASPNKWWGHWRTIMAYELTVECPAWAALMMWCIWTGKVADLLAAATVLTVWWGVRFGVLGVHVWTGSNERQTAITGQPIGGVASAIASAVTRKVR
ncbi:hypothetical protein NP284_34640 [Rhodopseudomonas pseudopalustris]|uniref:hypothetical protein n=1 Tax=Rhodopseudomonas pseudopalustris TaxID=1513892 RepID=UPI000B80E1B9